MIQLSSFMFMMIGLFGLIGFLRGWIKELIATAGIILALFAIKQFETLIIDPLTNNEQVPKFYLQALFLLLMTFFAYQTPPETLSRRKGGTSNREGFQDGVLGALVGMFNGYLVIGSLWYYMDVLEYPLSPHIAAAAPNTPSADLIDMLPLTWMLTGDGSLLSILMIGLFIFVIVAVI
ncbi:MAG: CvpA family protein [Anaerolineae bacterium]|nr:CvpA family protein [Anaerolineae bacterium]